ncbi:MAG TPA: tetratricopeptide repeat protein [Chthonomonadaceae bacterium]|nr:tetratricopeptide repeat protein [Chthonomonadaceae bacterium]
MKFLRSQSGRLVLGAMVVGIGAALFLYGRFRPSPAAAAYERGKILADAHLVEDAKAVYAEAIRLDPRFAPPYRALAEIAAAQGDQVAAIDYWQAYLAHAIKPKHAWCRLAECEFQIGKRASARRDAAKELQLDPDCGEAHLLAGLLSEHDATPQAALYHLERAARAFPDRLFVQFVYGRDLALGGQYDRAIQVLNGVVARDPRHAGAHRWLGYAYAHLPSRPDSARQTEDHLRRALESRPDYPEASYDLARLYQGQHQAARALPYARNAVRGRKHYPRALYLLARLYKDLGRQEEAARALKEFRRESDLATRQEALRAQYKSDPANVETALALSETLLALEAPQAAVEILRDAAGRAPGEARLRAALSQAEALLAAGTARNGSLARAQGIGSADPAELPESVSGPSRERE